jgi:Domain of unknown function (DUF5130)
VTAGELTHGADSQETLATGGPVLSGSIVGAEDLPAEVLVPGEAVVGPAEVLLPGEALVGPAEVLLPGEAVVGPAEVTDHGAPVHGHHAQPIANPEVIFGPLSTRALLRLDEAMRLADAATGLTFSVYIGELREPTREDAEEMLYRLADPHNSVLLAVSPNQRLLEIVTGSLARKRILDRDAKLAAMSMAAAFTGGDLGGGLVAGIAQLSGHAGKK